MKLLMLLGASNYALLTDTCPIPSDRRIVARLDRSFYKRGSPPLFRRIPRGSSLSVVGRRFL